MKAVIIKRGKVAIEDVPLPSPGPGEVLIRVVKAGICDTDLELVKGYMGFEGLAGHEFVGRVVGPRRVRWAGRRVVGEINLACGVCPACRGGLGTHCPERSVLGISGRSGAFAEFLTLPESNCHLVPDGIGDAEAVFVEPLAAALQILEQTRIRRRDRVCVLGDGKLGLLAARALSLRAARVLCIGRHPRKLALLRQEGLSTALDREKIGGGFDVVVEATGNPRGLGRALNLIRPRGRIVLKSTFQGRVRLDVSRVVVDEVVLIGSRCGPFDKALEALESGRIRVDDMIDGEFPLRRAGEAFRKAARPGVLKILLSP